MAPLGSSGSFDVLPAAFVAASRTGARHAVMLSVFMAQSCLLTLRPHDGVRLAQDSLTVASEINFKFGEAWCVFGVWKENLVCTLCVDVWLFLVCPAC